MRRRLVPGGARLLLSLSVLLGAAAPASAGPIVPLMKRLAPPDTAALQTADAESRSGTVDPTVKAQFLDRFQSLVLAESPDWATSWLPRNWHPNSWVYRKSTAYLGVHGVHTRYPQHFVKLNGTTDFAAINYACGAAGCTQPLLDVTKQAARDFWLRGSDNVVYPGRTCVSDVAGRQDEGVLDWLACRHRGLWLDDVLADLVTSSYGPGASSVANFRTGAPVANQNLATALPFATTTWTAGLASMLEQLRAGVAALRAAGRIPDWAGTVVINYKWNSFGYAEAVRTGAAPTLHPYAQRIIRAADLVEQEGGYIDQGLVGGPVAQSWSFQRKRRFVQQVHELGVGVIQEKTNSADVAEFGSLSCLRSIAPTQTVAHRRAHASTANYNLAATLLDYRPGDWVGDMCEYHTKTGSLDNGGEWPGYRELQSRLGAPTAETTVQNGALLRREFQYGYVLVAPPGAPTTTTWFPTRYVVFDRDGTRVETASQSVTLSQRQAAVVRYTP